MNTTEQAEFLESIMQELEADPEYTKEDKQIIKAGYEFVKPFLEPLGLEKGFDVVVTCLEDFLIFRGCGWISFQLLHYAIQKLCLLFGCGHLLAFFKNALISATISDSS